MSLEDIIYDQYKRDNSELPRPHLGASQIGHRCSRKIWYDIHWTTKSTTPGRVMKLAKRGHEEEASVKKLLMALGCVVVTQKSRYILDGRFGGTIDFMVTGLGRYGLPNRAILDSKMMNDRRFNAIQKSGAYAANYEYYAQMQVYMELYNQNHAILFCINKNDDHIHTEVIERDRDHFSSLKRRALEILDADSPPERAGEPDSFTCKFCPHKEICHKEEIADVNCRTCAHSSIVSDCNVKCEKYNATIPVTKQHESKKCPGHLFNPKIIPYSCQDAGEDWIEYDKDGKRIVNGEGGFPSVQFRVIKPELMDDEYIAEIQNRFEATFIGEDNDL